MNKGLRQKIKMNKYKRRLKRIRLYSEQKIANPKGIEKGVHYNLTGFRNHSNPCSCSICSNQKYKRENIYSIVSEGLREWKERYDEDWKQEDIIHQAIYGD